MKPQLWILLFLVSFSAVMAILFTPALPEMARVFKITDDVSQHLMTTFLFGYAFGQLFYGPFARAMGRKPAITIGCLVTVLGSLICLIAAYFHIFSWMLIGRGVTALGSAAGLTLSFTLISDTYKANKAKMIISYLMLSFGVFPGISLIIGGYLTEYLGWESCFIAMLLYSLFIMGISTFLPETLAEKDHSHLKFSKIIKAYLEQCKQSYLLISGIMMGLTTATYYLFQTEAPFIGIQRIGLMPDTYGLLAFIPSFGLSLGALISGFYSYKLSYEKANIVFISLYFLTAISMFIFFFIGYINPYTLFIPPFVLLLVMITIYSHTSAHALEMANDKAHASAFIQCMNIFTTSILVYILSEIPSAYVLALPFFFTIISMLIMLCFFLLMKIYRNKG